jgi:hypothetical protein
MRHVDGHRLADEAMTAHLGDEAEQLLIASGTPEMMEAARSLRLTALSTRRLLMRPLVTGTSLQMGPSVPDPELRRAELADLAVDVVTAADYLMRLLSSPAVAASRLALAGRPGPGGGEGYSDEETFDLLTRRQLDARGAAVRLGMRLLSQLHSDVAQAGEARPNQADPQAEEHGSA